MKSGQGKFAMACLSVAFALAASPAMAKTVLWYHFNERDIGYRPYYTSSHPDVVENAADPGCLQGKPGGLSTAPAFTSNQYPTYTNDFPSCATWYDPATGAYGADRHCLWMKSQYSDGSGESSVILTDDNEKLHCEKITVEFMAKLALPTGKIGLKNQAHMIGMRNSSTANVVAWGIIFYTSGKAVMRVQTRDAAGTGTDSNKSFELAESTSSALLDGKWHHVAFTYDGEVAKLYVDYALRVSKAWTHPLDYNEDCNGKLSICGFDKQTYGHWHGFIDEVRISDEALPPEKFLRPGGIVSAALAEKIGAVTDADTALYLPFDTVESACTDPFFGGVGAPLIFNAVTNARAPKIKAVLPSSGMLPVESQSTASSQIHAGIFAQETAVNGGSWKFGKNEAKPGRSIHMTLDDRSVNGGSHFVTTGDFTMEFFLNVHSDPVSLRYLAREQTSGGGTAWTLYVSPSGDRLAWSLAPSQGGDSKLIYKDGLTYNEWHHVAIVVNRRLRTAALYLDGEQVGEQLKDFDLALPPGDVADSLKICGGYGSEKEDQFHDLSIDELRITSRALSPQEFITAGTHGTTALEPTRAWMSFEGDMKVAPRPDEIPEGEMADNAQFSSTVCGNGTIIDGYGTILGTSNSQSIKFSGEAAKSIFRRNVLLEKDMESMTVEFFMKAPKGSATAWAFITRMYSGLTMADSMDNMNWTIGYRNADGDIYIGAVTTEKPADSQTLYFGESVNDFDDGRWHHVAVTFEPDGNGNTLVTVYKDYELCGQPKTFDGTLKHVNGVSGSCMAMGYNFNGWIDEFRISKGVLSVNEMIHAVKRGTVVIFR